MTGAGAVAARTGPLPDRAAEPSSEVTAGTGAPSPVAEAFRFGPLEVSVRVHGDALRRRCGQAIRHAKTAGAAAPRAIEIVAMDAAEGEFPAPPAVATGGAETVELRRGGGAIGAFGAAGGLLELYDAATRQGTLWARDSSAAPDWEWSAPFRRIFHLAGADEPWGMFHAAALSDGRAGLLLAGAGGSGKSTLTAAAVRCGLATAGDDLVLVEPAGGGFVAHRLYDTVKLDPGALARLALPAAWPLHGDAVGEGKRRLHLHEASPTSLATGFALHGLVLPRLAGAGPSRLAPAPPGAAMRALGPSTVLLLRGGEARTFAKAAAIVRALPAWRLDMGPDPHEAAAALAAFMAGLAP